jgi:hypothetical protein
LFNYSRRPSRRPRLATADETATALSFALRYQGRKRVFDADDAMARIAAEEHEAAAEAD